MEIRPPCRIAVRLLLRAGAEAGLWDTLRKVRKTAGYEPKAAKPVQETLFS